MQGSSILVIPRIHIRAELLDQHVNHFAFAKRGVVERSQTRLIFCPHVGAKFSNEHSCRIAMATPRGDVEGGITKRGPRPHVGAALLHEHAQGLCPASPSGEVQGSAALVVRSVKVSAKLLHQQARQLVLSLLGGKTMALLAR